jgi:hypothetical protein
VDPDVICDELDFLSAEIMADLSAGRDESAKRRLAFADRRACDKDLGRHVRDFFAPLVRIEKAIALRDPTALDVAVRERIEWVRREYSQSRMRPFPGGLMDILGLGLLQIARRHALETSVESVYLPKEHLTTSS